MFVLAVANQKGGVGKTTLCFHLSWILRDAGESVGARILAVDLDPQGNLSSVLGASEGNTASHVFRSEEIRAVPVAPGLDLVSCNAGIVEFDDGVRGDKGVLRRALRKTSYDFVIIDSPPSLNKFQLQALVAADAYLVPLHAARFSMEGLRVLEDTVGIARQSTGSPLNLLGYVINQVEGNTIAATTAIRAFKESVGESRILAIVPKSVKVEEAMRVGLPVWKHDPKNPVSRAFADLGMIITGQQDRGGSPMELSASTAAA